MARTLRHWIASPQECAYLPERQSALEYRLMLDVAPGELEYLLERGWRRFGPAYFRPACEGCRECVPLRLEVAAFQPSKQQRRAWNRGQRLRLQIGVPEVDERRIDLYHRWHLEQGTRRGWGEDRLDREEYFHQFAFPHPSVREFSLWDDAADRHLVAVGIVDETPNALSAVYSFYDPDYRSYSPGTLIVLHQIRSAQEVGKRYVYLGYRVEDCPSSAYKGRFQPHELLDPWPELDELPTWTVAPSRAARKGRS